MAAPETRPFSLAYEIDKLKKRLLLPITNIVFDSRYEYGKLYLDDDMSLIKIYAKLYIDDDFIGTIPYMSDRWGPMYDTAKLDEIAFDKIYQRFQYIIFDKIIGQEPRAATVELVNNNLEPLYVRDKSGAVINTAFCVYVNNEWNVVLAGPNPVTKMKVTNVVLNPPPPIKGA